MSFELFIGWLILSFVVGFIGFSRKIGFGGAFFASLLLSPLIGLIITLVSKSDADEEYKERTLRAQQEQQETLIKMSLAKPSAMSSISIIQELEKLKILKDDGVINEDEFLNLKKDIINSNDFPKSSLEKIKTENYVNLEKLNTGQILQFIDEIDSSESPEVRIDDVFPINGFYKLLEKTIAYEVIDGKILNKYYVSSFDLYKGDGVIEIGSICAEYNQIAIGNPVWFNNEIAPNGSYRIAFLDKIGVINGVINKI